MPIIAGPVTPGRLEAHQAIEANHPELLGGDAARFQFCLKTVVLQSDTHIEVTPGGVTAVVGGNNVGKSTLLREIYQRLGQASYQPTPPTKMVEDILVSKEGSLPDCIAWLSEHAEIGLEEANPTALLVRSQGRQTTLSEVTGGWQNDGPGMGGLNPFTCFYADVRQRFSTAANVESRSEVDDPPVHPIHVLEDRHKLLVEINSVIQAVFGQPLSPDNLGRTRFLRVGAVEVPAPRVDNITPVYREAMRRLPKLDDQGDGMRGFLSILLPLATATYPLVLIDEPEAFLHPPQAHALGRQLGRLAEERQLQVVVATHDQNLLAGLLTSNAPTSVVRLTRDQGTTACARADQVDDGALRRIWADPALRYTNLLDGLFHTAVVLAEGEGDCSYLSAALDYAYQQGTSRIPSSEVLFLPTGGKDGMAKVVKVLRAVNVPVIAAPDLDILSDKSKLVALINALGGSWDDDLNGLYQRATQPFAGKKGPDKVEYVLKAITSALEPHRAEPYTADLKAEVQTHLRVEGPWVDVKRFGIKAFKGDAGAAIVPLLALLNERHVVPVEVGELECLAPQVGLSKGTAWLSKALGGRHYENSETQHHVQNILRSIGDKSTRTKARC